MHAYVYKKHVYVYVAKVSGPSIRPAMLPTGYE